MRYLRMLAISVLTILFSTQTAFALTLPSFPSCVNPQGSLKASFDSGVHGIVGSNATYTGKDTVYQVNSEQLLQCFCPTSGSGIQTNWLKASTLTTDEINILKNEGWIFVANGALWGLEETAYIAKNHDYTCNGSSTGISGSTSSGSSTSSSPVQAILAASTTARTLANTGNLPIILAMFFFGSAFFFFGIHAYKKGK